MLRGPSQSCRIGELEVELVDVVGGELERIAEDDDAVLADRVLAVVRVAAIECRDREGLAGCAGEFSRYEHGGHVVSEVAKIRNGPQAEDRSYAVGRDELPHVVREAKSGDLDFAACRVAHDLGGSQDADGCRRDDERAAKIKRHRMFHLIIRM